MLRFRRFTLVELMIVVAIIAVLAAIAIPQFRSAQLRARGAEARTLLAGIENAQQAYHAAQDTFLGAGGIELGYGFQLIPDQTPGKTLRDWPGGSNFDTLGWAPDGQVRGSYACDGNDVSFDCYAVMNVDGDPTLRPWYRANDYGATSVPATYWYCEGDPFGDESTCF